MRPAFWTGVLNVGIGVFAAVVRPASDGELASAPSEARRRRRIGGVPGAGGYRSGPRGDRDDPPPPAFAHAAHDGPRAGKGGRQETVELTPPLRDVKRLDIRVR